MGLAAQGRLEGPAAPGLDAWYSGPRSGARRAKDSAGLPKNSNRERMGRSLRPVSIASIGALVLGSEQIERRFEGFDLRLGESSAG